MGIQFPYLSRWGVAITHRLLPNPSYELVAIEVLLVYSLKWAIIHFQTSHTQSGPPNPQVLGPINSIDALYGSDYIFFCRINGKGMPCTVHIHAEIHPESFCFRKLLFCI